MKKNINIPQYKIQNNKILSITDLYPDESLSPEEYVKEIPKNILLRYASFFLRDFDHMKANESSGGFLRRYFQFYNSKIYLKWETEINRISSIIGLNVTILYPLSNFKFFELAFNQMDFEIDESDREYAERSNINILKCYLSINKIFVDKERNAAESLKLLPSDEQLLKMSLMGSLMESDITKQNMLIHFPCQLVKCHHFFKFLITNDQMNGYLKLYLEQFSTSSVSSFISGLSILFQTDTSRQNEYGLPVIYADAKKYPKSNKFIRMFLLTETSDDYDFLEIRRKPLIEINPSTFGVIYEKFVVDKLYQGIFFGIGNIVRDSKSNINYLSDVGDYFFEKVLSYYYLQKITKSKSIKLSGFEIREQRIAQKKGGEGEPDYYVRDFNSIYLFEVKNTLVSSELKYSFDYERIENYLKERFLHSSKKKNKIITQLVESMKYIIEGKCDYDNILVKKLENIYPIAILPDETFSSYGLNFITNEWFLKEIYVLNVENLKVSIKPFIIITMDTLIYISYYIQKGFFRLKDLLDLYVKTHLKSKVRSQQKISFTLFAINHIQSLGLPVVPLEYFKVDEVELFSAKLF